MEWMATATTAFMFGAGIAGVIFTLWKGFKKDVATDHTKLDKTRSEIIEAYETRIQQLEDLHVANSARITVLESTVSEQTRIMEQQKKYIESLVELVTGRDPAIQAFLKVSETTLDKFNNHTAPKVDAIHDHLITKKTVPSVP